MIPTFHRFPWGCFFLLLFFIAGCGLRQTLKKPEGGKDFLQETYRLEKLAREHPETSVRAQSHLRLAFLFVNDRNPQLNYTRALEEMEAYLSLSPPAEVQTDNFRNWLAVLRKVDHVRRDGIEMENKHQGLQIKIEKLQGILEKLQKTNTGLGDEVASLKEMNNKMAETIERLKSLDLQMEEKRRLIK